MNKNIEVKIDRNGLKGTIVAYTFDDDGYTGIRIEFLSYDDRGQNPGRPAVSLEVTPDGELQSLIYDKNSEGPADDYIFRS